MVTRAGAAVRFSTPMYDYAVHANRLRRKHMTPLIMEVKARKVEDVTTWSSHDGDSGMAHMFLSIGPGNAQMASICYSDAIDGPGLMANVPEAEVAIPERPTHNRNQQLNGFQNDLD